ncbi:hypothetical protein GCM10025857_33370 [Alicyclobacillus contaminans]|nr:hypothetical protein GCM10025857_33370 [Alicyclobacillus contaminans]
MNLFGWAVLRVPVRGDAREHLVDVADEPCNIERLVHRRTGLQIAAGALPHTPAAANIAVVQVIQAHRRLNQTLQDDGASAVQPQVFPVFVTFIIVSNQVEKIEIRYQAVIHPASPHAAVCKDMAKNAVMRPPWDALFEQDCSDVQPFTRTGVSGVRREQRAIRVDG